MKTIIVAAFCGTGKTYLCKKNKKTVELEYWKYKNDARFDDYIEDLNEYIGNYDYVFISTEPEGLRLLHQRGFEMILVYPNKELRNEYLDRYIERDSPYDFIGANMKYWHEWLDDLEKEDYCKHVILETGEYLEDALNKIS